MAQYQLTKDSILEGTFSATELEMHYGWYSSQKIKYIPVDSICQELKPYASDIRCVLVMGTWCSDSREHVPAFFKLADCIGMPEAHTVVYGTLRSKRSTLINLDTLHINYVPTFIFFYKGKEIGRMIETPIQSIELDLYQLIRSATIQKKED